MAKYRLTESRLRGMIREAVQSVLRENDYEGNDLDYESIKMQAEHIIPRMRETWEGFSWRDVAEEMGFRLETLNYDDMELLKDTIEETMLDEENPYWQEDEDFDLDFHNFKYGE